MLVQINDSVESCGCSTGSSGCTGGKKVLVDAYDPAKIPGWVLGVVSTPAGVVPRVATKLQSGDILGTWKARWGVNRMDYKVPPGLYAAGDPGKTSPVLVSANYKMSFDRLRRELSGIDAWVLVLDTKGINVWCAAGKGTFGTDEIVKRVDAYHLSEVVTHKTLILPQLGAPGVSAHEVQKRTGFRVVYGPVRAADLPAFLKAGNKATPEMREVRFGFTDRVVLTPIELVSAIKPALVLLAALFVLALVRAPSASFISLVAAALLGFVPFLGAILAGAVLTPALLPFLPPRAFAWKGWLLGLIWAVVYVWLSQAAADWKPALFYLLALPPVSAYLAMNFTGASTYTSLSGVVKEMQTAVRAMVLSAGAGLVLIIGTTAAKAVGMI